MIESPVAPDLQAGAPSRLPLPKNVLVGVVLAVVAIVIIAYFSIFSLEIRTSTADAVTHALQAVEGLQGFLSTIKDAETGQRGYLLLGAEDYLEPYLNAKAAYAGELHALQRLLAAGSSPQQQQRLETLAQLAAGKMDEMAQTIALRRGGDLQGALAIVRTNRGKMLMDSIRALVAQMTDEETATLAAREHAWQEATQISAQVAWGSSALLLALVFAAAVLMSRNFRAAERQIWLRAGQMGLSARMQGEQRLEKLGANALEFLGGYLDAAVGALYIAGPDGRFLRVAGYALPAGHAQEPLRPGDGVLGQALKENRILHARNLPTDYLPVASSLGRGRPQEILVVPASIDGSVQAVMELGFLRAASGLDEELLARVSESFAVALRAARDRSRLEELLDETQRQAEELQAQQEELRVGNEELEAQARSLNQSQAQMESQQSELEQTNSQLEQQKRLLETRNDELSRAQAILNDKAQELERANQYKSEFLANMSHELRTPLNSALILANILAGNKQGNLTAEQVKYAQTIAAAGNDLLALIGDILDLSKIEAGKIELVCAPVAIQKSLESLTRTFQPLAQEKGLGFSVIVERDVPERIETDAQRLGQILKNLLSNALKFTETGALSLRVSSPRPDRVAFSVRDTGIGIAEHQHQIIFEAFRQADGSTHRKYGGTGLGLSISQDLARLLGGDIGVHSAPGKGSEFTLTLPVIHDGSAAPAAAQSAPAPRPTPAPRQGSGSGGREPAAGGVPAIGQPLAAAAIDDDRERLRPDARRLLVVEDDARFAAILRDLAHEMEFQCVAVQSAADALAAAVRYEPNAILLDVHLPDHSGMGVLDRLKRDPRMRHIPVYVVSVADFTRQALEMGAVGYALKPVKREQLVQAFRRLEAKFSQGLGHVLVVEDDERQRESIRQLLASDTVQITGVRSAGEALVELQATGFDCVVMDLNLPGSSGYELLEQMAADSDRPFPPVIIYTGRDLTADEEQRLRRYSRSIIIKDARSPERLLDEVTLFLHQVESQLPAEHQRLLKIARDRESAFEGRRILVVEDDARNIFALSSLLEPRGARVEIARNGREAIEALGRAAAAAPIDLVLMDIMMPEMDGLTATREIRKRPQWQRLPIIALTAKAMPDDQEKCLAAGVNDYIAKPLDAEQLLSLMRVWLPKERSRPDA